MRILNLRSRAAPGAKGALALRGGGAKRRVACASGCSNLVEHWKMKELDRIRQGDLFTYCADAGDLVVLLLEFDAEGIFVDFEHRAFGQVAVT